MTVCLVFMSVSGCANVYYVGDEYAPTAAVDFYYTEASVDKPYDLIGRGLGSGFLARTRKIKSKLEEEAKARGADAILITGLAKTKIIIGGQLNVDERHWNVAFLRYR
ncbi:MAG: hypothetical protein AAF564_05930 [Bacteroidota bacterium]